MVYCDEWTMDLRDEAIYNDYIEEFENWVKNFNKKG